MSLARLFKVIYAAGAMVSSGIRVYHRRRNVANRIEEDRTTVQDRSILIPPAIGMFVLPALYLFSSRLHSADYRLPSALRLLLGMAGGAVYGAGVWMLWRSHADLGRNWSPSLEIREGHGLVTEGVYRHIRHPMYASHVLWGAGQMLLLQNWIAGPATLVSLLPLFLFRIPQEEQMMLDRFGEEYRAYMDRTGRLVPRL